MQIYFSRKSGCETGYNAVIESYGVNYRILCKCRTPVKFVLRCGEVSWHGNERRGVGKQGVEVSESGVAANVVVVPAVGNVTRLSVPLHKFGRAVSGIWRGRAGAAGF